MDCGAQLKVVRQPYCYQCGKPVDSPEQEYCPDCLKGHHSYTQGCAMLLYEGKVKEAIHKIKYNNKREYLETFAELLARYGENKIALWQPEVLIPIPMYPKKQKVRGYNQAEILARVIGKKLGIPVMPEMLVRNKKTLPQKDLSVSERLKNLSGAFAAGEIPEGIRSVILVDDIYTTGSTIEACARALRASGISRIYFVVICMTGGR